MVRGDGGQCPHEASVFLEIEERPRLYRVSKNGGVPVERPRINFFVRTRRGSSSLRIYVLGRHAGSRGTS